MLHDCDFLDQVEPLRRWLGFETSRNPFFVPFSSQRASTGDCADLEGCRPLAEAWVDKTGLSDVGRQSTLGPFEVARASDNFADGGKKAWSRSGPKQKARRTDGASPYAAAVVNDPRLLPPTGLPPSRGGGPSSADYSASKGGVFGFPPTSVTVNVEGLVPNIVSRQDMERVGVAMRVLIEEEMYVVAAGAVAVAVEEEGESRSSTRSHSITPQPRKDSRNAPLSTLDSRKKASESREGLTSGSLHTISRNMPFHAASRVSARATAPSTPISRSGGIRALTLSAAGLMQQPPPEPHPGLGPVLLQSDVPGGEFHPNPFLHTVTNASIDERAPHTTSASGGLLKTVAARDRCSTAPAVPLVPDDFVEPRETFDFSGRSPTDRDRRAATAPSTASLKSVPPAKPTPAGTAGEGSYSSQSRQRRGAKGSARQSAIRSRRIISRKAGAELRALTAAGTTGRRQPPPREARLRRLARDVERHSAELRNLAREEEQLGKSLDYGNGRVREESFSSSRAGSVHTILVNVDNRPKESTVDQEGTDLSRPDEGAGAALGRKAAAGGPRTDDLRSQAGKAPGQTCSVSTGHGVESLERGVKLGEQRHQQMEGSTFRVVNTIGPAANTVKALLEAKRREIELKSFHLGVKRDELRCLLMVQRHHRHRKKDLELERLRTRLEEGQVRPQHSVVSHRHVYFPALCTSRVH